VIVRQPDLPRTEQLLESFGYRTKGHDETQRDYFQATGQYSYRHPDTGVNIDLHWELAPFGSTFPFTLAEMWSKIQDVPLAGHPVPTLAWDHMPMLLACHGTKERWRFLKWVCDFAFLVQARPELDWGAVFDRAKQSHCSRPLLLAVLLASDLLGVPAHSALLDRARSDGAVVALAGESTLKMIRNKPDPDFDEFIYSLNSLERLRDKNQPDPAPVHHSDRLGLPFRPAPRAPPPSALPGPPLSPRREGNPTPFRPPGPAPKTESQRL
jgi:hypothetical protein